MARPMRLMYIGSHKKTEWQEITGIVDAARFHNNGRPVCEVINIPTLDGDTALAKKARRLIPHTDYFYYPSDLVPYEDTEPITQRQERLFFRHQYKEFWRDLNKNIARRLDNKMCVLCRVLDRKIVQSDVVHHLVFGEHVIHDFHNLMTICPAHHDIFHAAKIVNGYELLAALKEAIGDTPQWRWDNPLEYYMKRY